MEFILTRVFFDERVGLYVFLHPSLVGLIGLYGVLLFSWLVLRDVKVKVMAMAGAILLTVAPFLFVTNGVIRTGYDQSMGTLELVVTSVLLVGITVVFFMGIRFAMKNSKALISNDVGKGLFKGVLVLMVCAFIPLCYISFGALARYYLALFQ